MCGGKYKSCFHGPLTAGVCVSTRGWSLEPEEEKRLRLEQLIPVEAKRKG